MASISQAGYVRFDFATDGKLPHEPESYTSSVPTTVTRYVSGTQTESVSGSVYDVYKYIGGAGYLYNRGNSVPTDNWQIAWQGSVDSSQSDAAYSNLYAWQIGTATQSFILRMAYDAGNTKVYYNDSTYTINDVASHVIQFRTYSAGGWAGQVAKLLVDGIEVGTASSVFKTLGSGGAGNFDWGTWSPWSAWDARIDKVYFESGNDLSTYSQIIPEPATLFLLCAGAVAFVRRKNRAA
jgi:hypothetical protein